MIDTKKFRATTWYEPRDNKTPDGKWVIGIDAGYSAVKVMGPSSVAIFPSFASRVRPENATSSFGELPDYHIVYTDEDTGETWLVGRSAQNEINDDDTGLTNNSVYGRERYADPMFKVLVRTGIAAGLLPGFGRSYEGRTIVVQTGYPPEYDDDNEELIAVFAGHHHFSIQRGERPKETYDLDIAIENVHVMPQPMGTVYSVAFDKDAKPIRQMMHQMQENVVVFDAGFGTLDIFPISNGHLQTPSTNAKLGMRRVMEETALQLRQVHRINVRIPALQKYLDTGKARYHRGNETRDIEFGDILENCAEKVCLEALRWMQQEIPLYAYNSLVLTGGTSAAWRDIIKREFANMETLQIISSNMGDNLPIVLANVRGYFLMRSFSERQ